MPEGDHKAGAYAGFDQYACRRQVYGSGLCDWNAASQYGAGYKCLNSGTGDTAALFTNATVNAELPRFAGWWGMI